MDFEKIIEKYHQALSEFHKGNPEPVLNMFSRREDVSLANPLGPAVRGRAKIVDTAKRAASNYRDGEPIHFENLVTVVTPELAFVVENERSRVKVGGRQDPSTVALRVTAIFRVEEGVWKIVHRHADPITSNRPAESLIQK
jgi:ketosteroid isomerase-like protein